MSENEAENFVDDDEAGLFLENIAAPEAVEQHADKDNVANILMSKAVDADNQYITFIIDTEEYGTPILTVQEIRGWMKTTPLPNTPDYVKGVTNLRGNIVPIFDLRSRFSGIMTEITDRHVVIMVEVDGRTIGLLVDAISDILTIEADQIQPAPTGNLILDAQYIDGLFASDERMVALVNINKLFDGDTIQSLSSQSPALSTPEA